MPESDDDDDVEGDEYRNLVIQHAKMIAEANFIQRYDVVYKELPFIRKNLDGTIMLGINVSPFEMKFTLPEEQDILGAKIRQKLSEPRPSFICAAFVTEEFTEGIIVKILPEIIVHN